MQNTRLLSSSKNRFYENWVATWAAASQRVTQASQPASLLFFVQSQCCQQKPSSGNLAKKGEEDFSPLENRQKLVVCYCRQTGQNSMSMGPDPNRVAVDRFFSVFDTSLLLEIKYTEVGCGAGGTLAL